MATISQRQEQFRQGRLAAGYKREAFWLDQAAQDALKQVKLLSPDGTTRDQIVNQALIELLAHNTKQLETNSMKPLETNQVLLVANDSVLETNSMEPLATNSNTPADRAELAGIARDWRGKGMTLDQIANRLNEAGWTPSAIPAKRTTADVWTAKTLSQLLNRDCKE